MTTGLQVVETGEIVQQMTAEEASSVTTQIVVKLDAIADNLQAVMPLIRTAITRQAHVALGYASPGAYVADRFGGALSRLGADLRREVVRELTEAGLSTRAIAPVFNVSQKTIVKDRQVIPPVSPGAETPPPTIPQGEAVSRDVGGGPDPEPVLSQEDCEELDDEASDALAERIAAELAASDRDYLGRAHEAVLAALPVVGEPNEKPVVQPPRITGTDGKSYPAPTEQKKPNRRPITDAARDAGWELRKTVEKLGRLLNDDRFNRNREEMAVQLRGHLTYAIDSCQGFLDRLPNS